MRVGQFHVPVFDDNGDSTPKCMVDAAIGLVFSSFDVYMIGGTLLRSLPMAIPSLLLKRGLIRASDATARIVIGPESEC